jgi:hypothetical protein
MKKTSHFSESSREPINLFMIPLIKNSTLNNSMHFWLFIFQVNNIENIIPQVMLLFNMLEETFIVISISIDLAPFPITNEAFFLHLGLPIICLLRANFFLIQKYTNQETIVDHNVKKLEIKVNYFSKVQQKICVCNDVLV